MLSPDNSSKEEHAMENMVAISLEIEVSPYDVTLYSASR